MFGLTRSRPSALLPREVLRDALLVIVLSGFIALLFNSLQPKGVPLIRINPYEILVPCPETLGEADPLPPDSPLLQEKRTLIIDARTSADLIAWSQPGALHVPFDYLDPVDPAMIKRIASSGAARVVVFGDGHDPDSGEQLGRELAGRGIRNVAYVTGGAPALKALTPERSIP
jgi:hypothetical protein